MTQHINALAEELEDLRTEKNRILASFHLADDKDMAEIRKWTKQQEAAIRSLTAQQDRCEQELNHALEEYEAFSTHASGFDPNALWPERMRYRDALPKETVDYLQNHFGKNFSYSRLQKAESDVRLYLEDDEHGLRKYLSEMHRRERLKNQKQKSRENER